MLQQNRGGFFLLTDLRSWIHRELKLGLLAVVDRQTLHQQGGETRAGATSEAVEHQEALKASALVSLGTERER